MGMHIDPTPSGEPEYNENEMEEQDLERQVREVQEEHQVREGHDERSEEPAGSPKPSFWRRLFGRSS